MAVRYTPGQLRSAVSIAPETYRHWKKALVPLRRERGHSPCFTSGDLVAIAVARTMCIDLGIRVGALSGVAVLLFKICNGSPWAVLERGKLIFDLPNGTVHFQPERANVSGEGALVVIPLQGIVGQLRNQLLAASGPADQRTLRFPPTALSPPRKRAALRGGL
jgi:hypothetical protein